MNRANVTLHAPSLVILLVVGWMCAGCRNRSPDAVAEDRSERPRAEGGGAGRPVEPVRPLGLPGTDAARSTPEQEDRGSGAATHGPEPIGGPWVTCYGNYRPTSTPERDVTRLGLLCGPANGMKLVGATLVGEAAETAVEHGIEVRAGECFRIFAVAEPSVSDLGVEVRSPKGVPVASDHNNDRWPMVNPDGPFCLLDAGRHVVRVHARQGRGRYALQIWRLP